MKPSLLLPLLILALAPAAQAAQRCITHPVKQRIARGIYLQQFALRCEVERKPAHAREVAKARDWLALCREAGGSAWRCAAHYPKAGSPRAKQALRLARAEHAAGIPPIPAPRVARPEPAPAAPARWRSPGLLTNH